MKIRGLALASAGIGAVALGTYSAFSLRRKPPPPLIKGNIAAEVFPLVGIGAGATTPSLDSPFIKMLYDAGATVVTFESDPMFFSTYESRFGSAIYYAKSLGLKVHIINQIGYAAWYNMLGLPLPFTSPPTLSQFATWMEGGLARMCSYSPDYVSVAAEPLLYPIKLGVSWSTNQLVALVNTLATFAKDQLPGVETWFDAIVGTDDALVVQGLVAAPNPNLNGIGVDLYDNAQQLNALGPRLDAVAAAGFKTGLTETWWESLYADPSKDNPANAQSEASWVSTSGIYAWASGHRATSLFSPFFSNKFVNLNPLPSGSSFTVDNLYNASVALYNDLVAGRRTVIYNSFANLAQTVRAMV